MTRYELVEHTADIAVRLRAQDLGGLCVELTYAVCDLFADAASVRPSVEVALDLEAPDRESLLVVLANELIYRREAEGLLLPELLVEEATSTRLRGVARGEIADEARHDLRAGLKAATWHELAITDTPDGLCAFLVFDV